MYSSCSSLISKNYVETILNESTVAIHKGIKCMAQPQGSAAIVQMSSAQGWATCSLKLSRPWRTVSTFAQKHMQRNQKAMDQVQKICLILYEIINSYWERKLQYKKGRLLCVQQVQKEHFALKSNTEKCTIYSSFVIADLFLYMGSEVNGMYMHRLDFVVQMKLWAASTNARPSWYVRYWWPCTVTDYMQTHAAARESDNLIVDVCEYVDLSDICTSANAHR